MAIEGPVSDTSRARHSDPEQTWPESVKVQLLWRDGKGRPVLRTEVISADQFFGRGQYGAPMDGSQIIQRIELMRRAGPPSAIRKVPR